MELEFVAGHAGLSDLQNRTPPLKPISYRDHRLVGTFDCEILAECTRLTKKAAHFPPWPMIRGIGVHRLVGPAMMFAIGLRVACKIYRADRDRVRDDGPFLDCRDQRFAAIEAEQKRLRHIDRKDAER